MNHTRKVHGGGNAARESRGSAKRTQLNASIAITSLGWLVACGSSSPPSTAPSGSSSGTSSGAASGAGTGTSSGATAGVASGSTSGTTSGATSGTVVMDATMPTSDAGPEASTDDSSAVETGPAAPTGEAGEACNPGGTCGAGLACANSICLPSGDAGEPCNTDMSCAVGLVCSPLSVTCVASGDAGEPCGPGNTCDNGLYCAVANGIGTCTVSTCAGQPLKPLPYSIAADFDVVYSLTNGPQDVNFSIINNLDCDTTTFAPIPNTGGSPEAGISDAGDASADADAGFPTLNAGGPQYMTYATPPPCYEFLFDPSCTTEAACGWAGAIFTTSAALGDAAADAAAPQANAAGVCIAPGATMVTFQARASLNGTLVKFGSTKSAQCVAGGDIPIASDPVAQQTACAGDTEFWLALTNDWATYTVSIPAGEQYNDEPMATQGVWNGFSAVFEPEYAVGGTYVFVKNITWTNMALAAPDAGDAASTSDAPSDTGSDSSSTDAPSE